jgi:hypothetical protein
MKSITGIAILFLIITSLSHAQNMNPDAKPTEKTDLKEAAEFVFLHPEVMSLALAKVPFAGWRCYPSVTYSKTINEPTQCLDCEQAKKENRQAWSFVTVTRYVFEYLCHTPVESRNTVGKIELISTRRDDQMNQSFNYSSKVEITLPSDKPY